MQISVLQWNIWYKEPIENILSTIQEINPDIVCLQEMSIDNAEQSTNDTVAYIAKGLGYNVTYKEIPLEDQAMNLANAIFSRFDIVKEKSTWINKPTGTGQYDDQYRAYVEAELNVDGKPFRVGTVHMSYTHEFVPSDRKLKETSCLVHEIKKNETRFVLTGDFNAPPTSPVIKMIEQQLKNVGPDTNQNTWTTEPFKYNDFEENSLNWRLDYIFASHDVTTLSSEIINTDYSDHLPILATFEV